MPTLIPDLSESEINDKSKTDCLGKFLVCLQALWFCVQCILRLVVGGKSIGLLELNVFGHALCILIVYSLWRHKPFDIGEPTIIQGQLAKSCPIIFVTPSSEFLLAEYGFRTI